MTSGPSSGSSHQPFSPQASHSHPGVPGVPGVAAVRSRAPTLDIWINFNAEICGAEVCCITAPGTSTEPTDWMTPPARAETLPGDAGEIRATKIDENNIGLD